MDYFFDQCEQTISRVADPRYTTWVSQVELEKNLCHQDYSAGNVLLLPSGALCIFDLDAVAQWDRKLFQNMMTAYTTEYPMTTDQLWVVWLDVQFPHLFYELASKYFHGRCDPDWTTRKKVNKLKSIIQTERSKASILEPLLGR